MFAIIVNDNNYYNMSIQRAEEANFNINQNKNGHNDDSERMEYPDQLPMNINMNENENEVTKLTTENDQYLSPRERAIREADDVVELLAEHDLDGFNLLGVVANPRGHSTASTNDHNHAASHRRVSSNSTSTSHEQSTFGATLSSVTEQIDTINTLFDSWSRHYLGTNDDSSGLMEYLPPTDIVGQLAELPVELTHLDLATVQVYLETCGSSAHQFTSRKNEHHYWHENIAPDSDLGDMEANDDEFMARLEDQIPDIFFETYFDLTDPKTFCKLLVGNEGDDHEDDNHEDDNDENTVEMTANLGHLSESLRAPTKDILRLPPPDSFTGHLDKVEIALLQQVRSKSIAFFHETNRFGQLKEWIAALVGEVQRVRSLLDDVQTKSVVAWELIPLLDKQRQDLSTLSKTLDSANDILRCKASISGLLSANDDLGAAEQIQYGRKLLHGHDETKHLDKLLAFNSVSDQFNQYESLIVANLGEELVEVFLSWNTFNKSARERARELSLGLEMCDAMPRIARLYENRLLDNIRVTVRTTVGEFAEDQADASVKTCVTSMSLERFQDCLEMLFEQVMDMLKSAVGVTEYCKEDGIKFAENGGRGSVASAVELSSKSLSELLRLRKEAHSLVTLDEMKSLWDTCIGFTIQLEKLSDFKATGLRSTLLAQAKAYVERQHESNMSSLVAALDSERWTQCDVSAERQAALTRLCSGRAVTSAKIKIDESRMEEKSSEAEVEGVRCKVVWSCLLLVEMLMNNIASAAHFQSLATNVVAKVTELLRLFNSRSTQLVLGAGAIHSAARLKSINAKHLSLVTQCLGMIISILPHVRAALMAQLPTKQHSLLSDIDSAKKEYKDHNEKVLNKFVTIIGGIVEHGLAPRIAGIDFDKRASSSSNGNMNGSLVCCVFLDGVYTNTKKMHQVLSQLLPRDHLQDVFSRIFAYVDQKVPALFLSTSSAGKFDFPITDEGKRHMLLEIELMNEALNSLPDIRPWDFTAIAVIERKLDYVLQSNSSGDASSKESLVQQIKDSELEINGNYLQSNMQPLHEEAAPERVGKVVDEDSEEETVSDKQKSQNSDKAIDLKEASNSIPVLATDKAVEGVTA